MPLEEGPCRVEGALRISPHYYNLEAEVDVILGALAEIVGR